MIIRDLFISDVTRDIPPVVYFHEQTPEKLARDDVLRDLARELLRRLLVEVDDRRDVARHVGEEEVADDHGEPQG